MNLSDNLTLAEVTRSESAKRFGIDNNPSDPIIKKLKSLAKNIFQPIRENFGAPIYISSGFRSEALNKALRGASGSQHTKGEAIDIDNDGTDISNTDIFNFIKDNLDFDQLIWEFGDDEKPDWVHVSYVSKTRNRKKILRAEKVNGITQYRRI